ncbi:HTH-type transcriptional repressor ComR [BD1-7 clade bacterium]|uniref:HTH-type transcriptional repressor ComR n=1 Tax=BD1-7 clade bacterium TaxID=2029982 RepID=A0A5S9PR84_9GAMM|nr:HTH-type transcriptional repressor ComR [BD1-7 clade bacterium]
MARQREFDEDEVLDAVMRAFWRGGYEATSLTDLMAATGLSKGSIYKAFGDKHQLFMHAIGRYMDEFTQLSRDSIASGDTPIASLQNWQKAMLNHADQDEEACKGCLAMNTTLELGPHDEAVRERLASHREHILSMMNAKVDEAQQAGELRQDIAGADITMLLGLVYLGLNVAVVDAIDKPTGEHLIDLVFGLLKPPVDEA